MPSRKPRAAAPAGQAVVRPDQDRTRAQEALAARGFAAGVPDGVAGPRTVAAVRAFQASPGDSETGAHSEAQLRDLLGGAC